MVLGPPHWLLNLCLLTLQIMCSFITCYKLRVPKLLIPLYGNKSQCEWRWWGGGRRPENWRPTGVHISVLKRSLTPEYRFQSLQVTPGLQCSQECKTLELPLSGLILALSGSSSVTYSKLPDSYVFGCPISSRRITTSSLWVCYEEWNNKYMQSAYDRAWPKMRVKLVSFNNWNLLGLPWWSSG